MHPTKPSSWAPGDPPGGDDWTGGSGHCRGLPRSPADVAGVFGLWYSCGLRTAQISWIHLSAAGSWCVTAASHPPFQVYLMTRTLALTHAHTHTPQEDCLFMYLCIFVCEWKVSSGHCLSCCLFFFNTYCRIVFPRLQYIAVHAQRHVHFKYQQTYCDRSN